jgi:hypothetical protein
MGSCAAIVVGKCVVDAEQDFQFVWRWVGAQNVIAAAVRKRSIAGPKL